MNKIMGISGNYLANAFLFGKRWNMTVTLFITVLTVGAMISGLLTEAIKKFYENAHKEYSANVIALVNAVVVGMGGTAVMYMLLGIAWTVNNVICLVLMGIAVWVASMIGYDKVIQMLQQIADIQKEGE